MDLIERILSIFWPIRTSPPTGNPPPPPAPPSAATPPGDAGNVKKIGPQADVSSYRRWRLTFYFISDQRRYSGPAEIPVYDVKKKLLAKVEPEFFAEMGLEGTGKMRDGRLLNVASTFVPVSHEEYAAVWEYHKKHLSHREPGYSGIVVKDDKVVKAMAYNEIPPDKVGKGYGILRDIPLEPFRTLAADIGATKRSEPKYKGKGGVVPALSKVFIKEFVGMVCPDGAGGKFTHDGWCVVNDTGGGIFGCHFDVFVGSRDLVRQVKIPAQARIWFEGIEERVPADYVYGLHDA